MVQFVTVNGANLAYQLSGPESAPLIITLHGGRGMGDHRSDYRVYSALNDQFRVLSFDFRGHGASSRTKPYTFEQLVDDIEGVRAHFVGATTPVVICGGSFGGFLAQHYAIKYPSHVSHLILRGTAASHHHEEGAIKTLEARVDRAPNFSKEMLRDKVFGAFESDEEFRLVHFAMMPLYREDYNANNGIAACLDTTYVAESHNDLYSQNEKYFDYREDLGRITAKTLAVVGDQDWICPLENSKLIAKNIPRAELFIVEGANHSVHVEKPDLVIGKIRDFLASK
ncbi:alpha/beta-hydrolase [Corynespora cassiicola Philippines]|uniref:Alpha/beta-hydrolase n=1 Tax=Corynespora cassiicola Philippines TaxID=1448308 RepID=A0A2T2NXV5_CORCC|nr:alpha/beta-hydrolase [Corynespora cassiicola Philippines]